MKKILGLTVAIIIMFVTVMPNSMYQKVYASGTADDIVNIAKGEVGYCETGTNITKYWADLDSSMQGQSWCAAFIVWCARKAGIGSDIIPTSYSAYDADNSMKNWFSARGRYYLRGTTTPQKGDLIIFKYSDGNKHIGLVTGADSSNVYTIEGNKSDKVCTQTYSLTNSTIDGYCRPAYAVAQSPSDVSLSTDAGLYSEGDAVKFNLSANNASSYKLEIRHNDVIIWQGDVWDGFLYTPPWTGTYYATLYASNETGTASSDSVQFLVGVGSRSVSGDFNGDGRDDYAVLFDYGNYRVQWHVFLSTGSEFSEEIWWQELTEGWYGAANSAGRVTAGDYNGDGLDDVAIIYEYGLRDTKIHVFLSTGTSFEKRQTWYTDSDYTQSRATDRIATGDYNGDGLDDIAVMYEYDVTSTMIHVFLSTGTSFNGWENWFSDTQTYAGVLAVGRFVAGDFNGDGLDDVAAMYQYGATSTKVHVFLSTGNSFTIWQDWFSDPETYAAERASGRIAAGDFNSDGKDDIAVMYKYGESEHKIHVFSSTGTAFLMRDDWSNENQFYPSCVTGRFMAGDFNGDGTDDIATMYNYGDSYIIFHMYLSDKTKFNHEWWNQIDNYNARRTTGFNAYTDNYIQDFVFNHKHTYKDVIIPPTCTEQGYTLYTCTKGDNSYKDNYTEATGHDWGEWVVVTAPTTSQTGTEKRVCSVCNAEETRSVAALPTPTPTVIPTVTPTQKPITTPTAVPTPTPTVKPTATPTVKPTPTPTAKPTAAPTVMPTPMPTATPTVTPTVKPTPMPTTGPTATPTVKPTTPPTAKPTEA
ncbi:MAG: FG-GAP-like repeat-containing protein, partial [Candidatus Ornithomonoglobus sp.]